MSKANHSTSRVIYGIPYLMFQQQQRRDLVGEKRKETLRVQFDPIVKVEFHGAMVTSDGGLLVYREMDETLGLTALAEEVLQDPR